MLPSWFMWLQVATCSVAGLGLIWQRNYWFAWLLAGETIQYTDDDGFRVIDASGQVKSLIAATSLPLPTGASTSALQGGGLPAALGAGGGLKVDGSGTALPVSGTVTVTDGAGALNVICDSGCAGGTQYAVDTALGATPTGTLAIAIRDDALGALTPVEGDAIGLRVDANGALWTHDDALDVALSGSEFQVDIVAALPAGTNAIGKLTANSGVDIGDVDILSIAAGDNN